jgi:hypothetical protein
MDLNQIKQMDSKTLKERLDQIENRLREFSDVDADLKKEYKMLFKEESERLRVIFYDFVKLRKSIDKKKES